MKAILLDCNGEIKAIHMPQRPNWHWFNEQIEADMIEPMRSDKLPPNYIILTNREVFVETSPANAVAIWLTGRLVAEKALICKVEAGVTDPEAENARPIGDSAAELLVAVLRGLALVPSLPF